jgi:hypothetical protein
VGDSIAADSAAKRLSIVSPGGSNMTSALLSPGLWLSRATKVQPAGIVCGDT